MNIAMLGFQQGTRPTLHGILYSAKSENGGWGRVIAGELHI